jgi:hypothetical protein
MYYLKCPNCGHYNELKTEYLTFCKKCNKVLGNSFTNWKKENPERSFEDFKQIICTTEPVEQPAENSNKKKSRSLKYWIGFTVGFAIFYAIGQFGGDKLVSMLRKPAFDKNLMEIASELNKTCPVMVDSITRFDNATALPDKVFQYNYSILSVSKGSIDAEGLKAYLSPRILNDVKTNPGMKFVRDNKVTVNYSYKDINGIFLFLIAVKPEDYQ